MAQHNSAVVGQWPRLVEDGLGHAELSEVMEDAGPSQSLEVVAVESHSFAEASRHLAHS
jgi:hypothetical protein